MGRIFLMDLKGSFYSCKYCHTPIALEADLLSKSFYTTKGRAYLFYKVVNVTGGRSETLLLRTGWHTVHDMYCVRCGSVLGWKYVTAYENNQKFKEGYVLIERCKVLDPDGIPDVANQQAQDDQEHDIGQEAPDDEEPEIGQEAQDDEEPEIGQEAQDDEEPEIGQEAQAGGRIGADNA